MRISDWSSDVCSSDLELHTPIRPEHFFEPLHQRIYERILKLVDRNATASPVTLKPYFEGDTALSTLGGTVYLAQLTADGQGLLAPGELAAQIRSEKSREGKECDRKCKSRWSPDT